MLRHTGEKPLRCPQCHYTTGHWDNYKRHQKTHGHSGGLNEPPSTGWSILHQHLFYPVLGGASFTNTNSIQYWVEHPSPTPILSSTGWSILHQHQFYPVLGGASFTNTYSM
ncbi:hypothetical protein AB205_0099750 [Aquarana catesbeiana]|uniref:C2H2-type domain-containing protein n=1 Tax=Aquarana catesbeiana TaxID=8400 RepID=A0A2G9R9U9_AQUCT|nr:hypothetical protein AB205_0099750 [Aquarana catesbeiana]